MDAHAGGATTDAVNLASLLENSRSPEGRARLAADGTLPSLLRHLFPSSPLLRPLLCLLRNLCAGEPANPNSFLRLGGPSLVAAAILSPSPPPGSEVKRVALQLLGNAALAGEEHRAEVWARFFPAGFLELARIREAGVCDPLCMVLDTCCASEGGRRRLEELCEIEKGISILVEIITTASSAGYQEEWFEWLFVKVCVEEPYFVALFTKLGLLTASDSSSDVKDQHSIFGSEQAFLMRIISNFLSERPSDLSISQDFALGIFNVLKEASGIVDFSCRGDSALPTGSPAIDILGYACTILRDVCAQDEPLSGAEEAVGSLFSSGLLQSLLGFLHDLEPPSSIRKLVERNIVKPMTGALKVCPYKGFRRDVVSVISNCLLQGKQVQDEIRQQNGMPVLLQQCVVDEDNPFLREWGLMAVRNLLQGNVENQQEVSQFGLQGTVDTPEISELGLKVEVDKISGRAKLVNFS